ncbi:uncharacterized protein BYT42DRAFT_212629 [Radiomyces spectabilis]|uniref:uncharacterized protein n=1 Tax=Radiomyces spectabilis TaxID=64574 RepID=UPI00221FE5F7|nr:uncharacterized protein BYT42DRAFT_212629 [Radiomyces spectabilis]KAI8364361.1 hypothetical protein BYT42DRAFT_212629 [Radiomyces spectabilis]
MERFECDSVTVGEPRRPIPYAVLKLQFQRLVAQYDVEDKGVIFTKDLLTLIDQYENEHDVVLLTDEQKKAIQPYCHSNPDLEMTADDILNLFRLVFQPSPIASISAPTSYQPMTTSENHLPIISETVSVPRKSTSTSRHRSTPWKRRPSAVAAAIQARDDRFQVFRSKNCFAPFACSADTQISPSHDIPKPASVEAGEEEEDSNQEFAQYYRRSIELTKRLKLSERSLASMTRDNEDRILMLQNRVDDMNQEVIRQKKEILEYKNKEKNSLDQISALESHISHIQRSETDQKQVYISIRTLFDEKCKETQELQDMLREKELHLEKTEDFLRNYHREVAQLTEERNRLMGMQKDLERELESSHHTHMQLAEQRSENERLKEIIDNLKYDLDEARNEQSTLPSEAASLIKTLEAELEGQIQRFYTEEDESKISEEEMHKTEEKLKTVETEKDYYKHQAHEALEDLDKARSELNHLKQALDSENQLLVNELAELRLRKEITLRDIDPLNAENSSLVLDTDLESCLFDRPSDDIWAQSRIRQRKFDKNRKARGMYPGKHIQAFNHA